MIKAMVKPLLRERNYYITFGLFNYHFSYVKIEYRLSGNREAYCDRI